MNVLEINVDTIIRFTGDPALYAEAPFLEPMRQPTLNLHLKYKRCTTCQKNTMRESFKHVANAFTKLCRDEAVKNPNGLPALKAVIHKIMNSQFDEILIRYKKDGQDVELKF